MRALLVLTLELPVDTFLESVVEVGCIDSFVCYRDSSAFYGYFAFRSRGRYDVKSHVGTFMMTSYMFCLVSFLLFIIIVGTWLPVTWAELGAPRHPGGSTNDDVSKTVHYEIQEEIPVPHYMGNVKKSANLHDPSPTQKHKNHSSKSPIRFHFRSPQLQTNHHLDLFRLDEVSGDLFLVQRIDRDFLCPSSSPRGPPPPQHHKASHPSSRSAECLLAFDVVVKPIQYFRIIKVNVLIEDINDNSPRFQKKKSKLEIVESSPVGSLFLLPAADDDDVGLFGVQEYQLLSRYNEFDLKMTEHADGSVDARLRLSSRLDRETRDHYEITLIAIDGGRPPRSGSTAIDVVVLDSNDNAPSFQKPVYQVVVPENSPVGTSVVTVLADDKDIGVNAEVTYSFIEDQDLFGLEPQTGVVYLRHALDYEQTKQHRLTVSACNEDSAEYPLSGTALLVVVVDDVNDEPPQITINLLTASREAEVLENAAVGLFVAHTTVKDADSGSGGDVTCSLDDQSNFRLEQLFSNEYKITTGRTFDREVRDSYKVLIMCQDHGSPSLRSNRTLNISILDDNDNSPTFDRDITTLSIPEDVQVGYSVVSLQARDTDSGRNGVVSYSLVELTRNEANNATVQIQSNEFSINHHDGTISTRAHLDYEAKTKYQFIVRASDSGEPPRTTTCTVVLNVVDANDNAPRFERQDGYFFSISENSSENSFVGVVKATDKDSSAHFRMIFYSIDDSSRTFKIDPDTGEIVTTTKIDREQKDVYEFTVQAENVEVHGELTSDPRLKKQLSSKINVTVSITDINDNSPIFVYPNTTFHSIDIYRNVASYVGSPVVRCYAVDPDDGLNAVVRYEIVFGNENNKFRIDPVTGVIYVDKNLIETSKLTPDEGAAKNSRTESSASDRRTVFHLVLKASDSGLQPHSATAKLLIYLNDTVVNDHPTHASSSSGAVNGTFISSIIGSIIGGILVICCLVWGMILFCRVSRKQGRLRSNQIGNMFYDEKYEKDSSDAIDLSISKPDLGLSVKSLNARESNSKFTDRRTLRNSMPNLQTSHPPPPPHHHHLLPHPQADISSFACRCHTCVRNKLNSVDELANSDLATGYQNKKEDRNSNHQSQTTREYFRAPRSEHASLMSRFEPQSCPGCSANQDAVCSIPRCQIKLQKSSHCQLRSDLSGVDSDSTCSDSGRGLSEDERCRQTGKRQKTDGPPSCQYNRMKIFDRPLLSSPPLALRHKPQVSFRLSPIKPNPVEREVSQPDVTSTLPLLKTKFSADQNVDAGDKPRGTGGHIWTRTLAGVASEI